MELARGSCLHFRACVSICKVISIASQLLILAFSLIKLAILHFYRRFTTNRRHLQFLFAIGVLIMTWPMAWLFVSCIIARSCCDANMLKSRMLGTEPRAALWTPSSPDYTAKVKCTCEVLGIVQSSVQALVDVCLVIVPIPVLIKLKISSQKKGNACYSNSRTGN